MIICPIFISKLSGFCDNKGMERHIKKNDEIIERYLHDPVFLLEVFDMFITSWLGMGP